MAKLVYVVVHIEITNDDHSVIFGSLSVSCIYEILNFEEVIKVEPDEKLSIPQHLKDTLNLISTSTVRGIMFSTFKGTSLHGAILPIIDPKKFQSSSKKTKNRER